MKKQSQPIVKKSKNLYYHSLLYRNSLLVEANINITFLPLRMSPLPMNKHVMYSYVAKKRVFRFPILCCKW